MWILEYRAECPARAQPIDRGAQLGPEGRIVDLLHEARQARRPPVNPSQTDRAGQYQFKTPSATASDSLSAICRRLHHSPTGQCWSCVVNIGKSAGFPVARSASIPTAAAAMRQSAWWTVTPLAAGAAPCAGSLALGCAERCEPKSSKQPPHEQRLAIVYAAPDLLDGDDADPGLVAPSSHLPQPVLSRATTQGVDENRRIEQY